MMKNVFSVVLVLLATQSLAQKNKSSLASKHRDYAIPLTASQWRFQAGKVDFLDYKGQRAMRLAQNAGPVVLNEVVFQDGTIEFDLEPLRPESAQSIYFHRHDSNDQEIVYLRTNSTTNPLANDGIQYSPYVGGVNLWDLYPEYQAPALLRPGEWNHLKLVISGSRLQVFLNQAPQAVLDIPKLEATARQGSIAFEGASYVANVQVKPNIVESVSPSASPDLTDHDPNYLRTWAVSTPQELPDGHELSVRQLPSPEQFTDSIGAERRGLLNLTRKYGASKTRRVVWLQTTLLAREAVKTFLQVGFSDEVWVFLNHQPVLVDKNLYQYNMRKYPDGRISTLNATAPLNLRAGQNDLLIGVANDFYGWGLMARLESTNQIQATGQVAQILSLASELASLDVSVYEGTYRNADVQFTLRFLKKGKTLQVQLSGQDGLALQALGHHSFLYPSSSATFDFDLAHNKVTLRQGNDTREFTKE
ncbi:hypothetical protein GCM10028819_14460 [Spirosoma humi]